MKNSRITELHKNYDFVYGPMDVACVLDKDLAELSRMKASFYTCTQRYREDIGVYVSCVPGSAVYEKAIELGFTKR